MRRLILILMLGFAGGCARQDHRTAAWLSSSEAERQPLTEAEILAIARQAHAAKTVFPARYKVHGLEADRQGINWMVHVWLLDPGSNRPLIGDSDAEGEVFRISGDGKVISYDPNVFP